MKTFTIMFLLALVAVFSWSDRARGQADVFIDTVFCGMFDSDCATPIATQDNIIVINNNSNGNSHLRCKATVTPPAGGTAVKCNFANTGAVCFTTAGITGSWQENISASGEATLQCHVNPGNP